MSRLERNSDTNYSRDGSKFRRGDEAVVVELKQSEQTGKITAVVGLGDAVSSHGLGETVQTLEKEYLEHIANWREQMMKLKPPNVSNLARWRLANSIVSFANNARRKGLQVANLREALIRDLPISKSSLGYLIRFRERYASPELLDPKLSWSSYRELLDFKSVARMRECEALVRKSKITSVSEIRRMCSAANRGGKLSPL